MSRSFWWLWRLLRQLIDLCLQLGEAVLQFFHLAPGGQVQSS
jgi:hypothetical protein